MNIFGLFALKKKGKRKKHKFSIILIFVFFLEFNLAISNVLGRTESLSKNWTEDIINPYEKASYHFPNDVLFEIMSNSRINLFIEYEKRIKNRQSSLLITNNEPISLNITSKINMKNFGISNPPDSPKKGNFQLRYQYNCIFKIITNTSIDNFTLRYRKNNQFGLNSNINYSLAIFDVSQDTWILVDTNERINESNSESYIESSILEIEAGTEYYITLFEFSTQPTDLTWIYLTILIVSVSIISIAFLISKKEYFQYLKRRTISIEKGAHRLSLEEVLENENRNKIIELILNEAGIHFNELLRRTELAAGNLVWHLDILQTYKIIGKKRVGNFIAYFPYYQKNPLSNIDLTLQKSKLTLEILEMIEQKPGVWNNLITKKFKVDHKTIHYHLNKLHELGLIKLVKEGRKKKIYPNFESDYYKKNNNIKK
jgi:predicted transcriptional regulator